MTPFSKVKTWIKQGFYEKLPSSKSLRGALDLQQEIMDSMIREGLAGTVNCCDYFPTIPEIVELRGQFPPTAEQIVHVPKWGYFIITQIGDENCAAIYIKLPNGNPVLFLSLC